MIPIVLFIAACVRVSIWWQNRALFIDEANLARNFCDKGAISHFLSLDYGQYAPPLFCVIEKLNVWCWGNSEYALRLFPLMCGLSSLPLFYTIAKQLIPDKWILLLTLWIFCFSDILLRYATEAKQYGCDLAVALGLVAMALWQKERSYRTVAASTIGAIVIWLSMPSVFILAGVGLFFFYRAREKKNWRLFRAVSISVFVWLCSFVLYYTWQLLPGIESVQLVASHQPWFLPMFPENAAQWQKMANLVRAFPYYSAGHTVLALACGSAGILSGIYSLIRRRKPEIWLLVLPVLACLVTSAMKQYSLVTRMIVWTFPLVMLVQGIGWQGWWLVAGRYIRLLWIVVWIGSATLHTGWRYLIQPFAIEEVRTVLDVVRWNFQLGDAVYVHHEAMPAVIYYRDCYNRKDLYWFNGHVIYGDWNAKPVRDSFLSNHRLPARIWAVYSHVISDISRRNMADDVRELEQFAQRVQVIEEPGAYGYLFVTR